MYEEISKLFDQIKELAGADKQAIDTAWLEEENGQKTINAPILGILISEEYGLYKNSEGIFDKDGNRHDDSTLEKILRDRIGLYIPAKAANIAKYQALPVLLDKIPKQDIDISNDGVAAYISKRMRQEIDSFTRAGNISTGFADLDKKSGGLFPGLYIIGAISSLGKTTLIHQIADNIATAGKHVLFFSLEMSRLEMVSKSIARKTAQLDIANAMTSLKIRNGITSRVTEQATQAYIDAVGDRMNVIEGSFDTTVKYIWDYTAQYIEEHKEQPIVIIDYLQVIQGAPKTTAKESVDYNVVELKRMSRALRVPVIAISSVNRGNYLAPVDFESFKESGGIEYTADCVWGLQLSCMSEELFAKEKDIVKKRERVKEAKEAPIREVSLVCLKNRYGSTGWEVKFKYQTQFDLFTETQEKWIEVNNPVLPTFG